MLVVDRISLTLPEGEVLRVGVAGRDGGMVAHLIKYTRD